MAEGTREDWAGTGRLPQGLIYPELVHSGLVETLQQNTDAFNAASLNTLRLVTRARLGDFSQESFYKNVASLVTRRLVDASPQNPTVVSKEIAKDEFISVKLNRRIGPVDQTLDSFRKSGVTPNFEVISFTLGEMIAKAMQVDWLDSGLTAICAALVAQASNLNDPSPHTTIKTTQLVDGLALMGDKAADVAIWVMHSKVYFDLVKEQIGLKIDGISNYNIAAASPITLNRPVLVSDSASLLVSGVYRTLGLTRDAVVLEESEDALIHTDVITGKENIVTRMQGEYAFNLGLKGFKWDVANGGVNPDATAIGTGTNWDKAVTSFKDLAGVVMLTK